MCRFHPVIIEYTKLKKRRIRDVNSLGKFVSYNYSMGKQAKTAINKHMWIYTEILEMEYISKKRLAHAVVG